MIKSDSPVIKDLVLVGGGHAHVSVLKNFGMRPLAGVRLTLISRELQAPYSGMLPGYIAGHYSFDEAHIDLRPLARFANARFYHDEVIALDSANKRLICKNRPDVHYDVLSINIGSAPLTSVTPGASDNAIPVKPIDSFLSSWERGLERMIGSANNLRVGVVGAGAGGVELLLSIQYRLGVELKKKGLNASDIEFHLFTDENEILVTFNSSTRKKFKRVLKERGVHVHTSSKVSKVDQDSIQCANGETFPLDEVFWVTMAGAQEWVAKAGLQVDDRGFVNVDDTLESVSHEGIFAVGDIANMVSHMRPKSGVFAVRQGLPLFHNLQRKLLQKKLKKFTPQKQFLSLISTGDQYAIASRSWWAMEGRSMWRWKDWIDRRFMAKFNELPVMVNEESSDLPSGLVSAKELKQITENNMRCGGCGSKVGAGILEGVLSELAPVKRDDVVVGLDAPDDAAVVSVPTGKLAVQTVDFFRSFIDDPYIFGQIAANHALSDIFAMGAEPQTALAIVTLPNEKKSKLKDHLLQMMQGAVEVLNKADTTLIGGHTAEAMEVSLGFAVNGLIDQKQMLLKQGMEPGQRLVMTKPLGTGTLLAADMRYQARGSWISAALDSMVQSNRAAARCLREYGATACSDITGFGLIGHLTEMVRPSSVNIELDLNKIPCLEGAEETIASEIFSSLYPENKKFEVYINGNEGKAQHPLYPLLFDPQTAGGLLASVPVDRAGDCVEALHSLGYKQAALIGNVVAQENKERPITILN